MYEWTVSRACEIHISVVFFLQILTFYEHLEYRNGCNERNTNFVEKKEKKERNGKKGERRKKMNLKHGQFIHTVCQRNLDPFFIDFYIDRRYCINCKVHLTNSIHMHMQIRRYEVYVNCIPMYIRTVWLSDQHMQFITPVNIFRKFRGFVYFYLLIRYN